VSQAVDRQAVTMGREYTLYWANN